MKNLIRIIDGIILSLSACGFMLTMYAGNVFYEINTEHKGQFPYFFVFLRSDYCGNSGKYHSVTV